MKTNVIKAFSAVLLIGVLAIPAFVLADEGLQTDGGSVNGANASFTTGGSDTNGAGSAFTTGGADTNGASASFTTGGSNTNGASDSFTTDGANTNGADQVLTTGGANTNGADVAPVTPSTPPSTGGSSGGGSSSSSGGSSRIVTPIGVCTVYLNDYLKLGGNNSQAEVTKLQAFLKNVEKLDVDINSAFDVKTFEAVKSFQKKYSNDILSPWGSNNPTGQVYFTTKKKINEIYCNAKLSLSADQLAQIEIYKKSVQDGTINTNTDNTNLNTTPSSTTPEVGTNADGIQNIAAAGTSIPSKIWKFIKWVFGY